MHNTGHQLIGYSSSFQGDNTFQSIAPATGETLPTLFYSATEEEVNQAVSLAKTAFHSCKSIEGPKRASFLKAIAQGILDSGDQLLDVYQAESGLPRGRAEGERGRTVTQIQAFAEWIERDDWRRIVFDPALPTRTPVPKPELISWENALGPVVVFGSSNFPLAFSVAGGDTISALAAGCSVIFKAHPAHPGTSEIVGQVIQQAAQAHGMPEGIFSMLHDSGFDVGQHLVQHPDIQAVAFTGSFTGGKALFDLANKRPKPIPVYAEMGSINPVFVFPDIAEMQSQELAQRYVDSLTLGVGQFCTNPGLVFLVKDSPLIRAIQEKITLSLGGVLLTQGIHQRFDRTLKEWKKQVALLGTGKKIESIGFHAQPHLFLTDWATFQRKKNLHEEVFGPAGLLVTVQDVREFEDIADQLDGQLTISLHGTAEELSRMPNLRAKLQEKAGRLVFNGFPTGVEVSPAMVHGGPFPAATDSRSTSVGLPSLYRFTRPISFQDAPWECLPSYIQTIKQKP